MQRNILALPCVAIISSMLPSVAIAEDSGKRTIQLYESLVLRNNADLAALNEQLLLLTETSSAFLVSDSNISVSGGYSYNPTIPDEGAHDLSGSASLHIPVLPQFSIMLQGSTSGNVSVSVSLDPLAGLGGKIAIEEQIEGLKVGILYKRAELGWESRTRLLQHAAAKQALGVRTNIREQRLRQYEAAERQFDAGFISSGELRSAADAFAIASVASVSAMQQEANAAKSLFLLAGIVELPEQIFDFSCTIEQIQNLVSEGYERYDGVADPASFISQSRQMLLLQKRFKQQAIETTWAVEPGVTLLLSGSIADILDAPSGAVGANVSLQLSAASFHFDEIRELDQQLSALETALSLDQVTLSIEKQIQERALESATLSTEIASRSAESARDAVTQAERDLAQDNISQFEYQDIQFDFELAEIGYLNSLIALYGQIGMLLQFYEDDVSEGSLQ